jgi:hypothetical protein
VSELADFDKIVLSLALLGPGFLILFGRSRFQTGRMTSLAEGVFDYLMVTSVYYAFAYPIYLYVPEPGYWSNLVFLFLAPFLVGTALGFFTQKHFLRGMLKWLGLNPVHASPTGWDYMFSDRKGFSWIVVTLMSGRKYYGVFGPESLASSDFSHRDIYIEDIRDEHFQPIEKEGRKRGVWLNESEISSIEIVKDKA